MRFSRLISYKLLRLVTPSATPALPLLILAVILSGCAAHAPVPGPTPRPTADHTIELTWNQSFANNPACSTSVTVSCISGFNLGYLDTAGNQVQLHQDAPAVCTGTVDPRACASTFNGTLPIGSVVFYCVTTFKDQNGADGVTARATSPAVQVGADPATNVKATITS
jgi:hypothetical protein